MTRPAPSPAAAAHYARIKRHLSDELAHGRWGPGDRMPSEAELCAQFGLSRMTVNRALRELQSEGLIERVQGVGTFAATLQPVSARLAIRDLHEEIAERGHSHRADVVLVRQETASEALAQRLGLIAGAPVFHSLIVHHENGVPLQCEDRYVNPASAPGYLSVDFSTTTPTHYLMEVAPRWQGEYSIESGLATLQEAQLLRIGRLDPCLVVVRRTLARGVPITLARLVHPGARYRLHGEFLS